MKSRYEQSRETSSNNVQNTRVGDTPRRSPTFVDCRSGVIPDVSCAPHMPACRIFVQAIGTASYSTDRIIPPFISIPDVDFRGEILAVIEGIADRVGNRRINRTVSGNQDSG